MGNIHPTSQESVQVRNQAAGRMVCEHMLNNIISLFMIHSQLYRIYNVEWKGDSE
jgi:hypothetical protein